MRPIPPTGRFALAAAATLFAAATVFAQDGDPAAKPGPAPHISPRTGALLRPILNQRLDLVIELLNGTFDRESDLAFTDDLEARMPLAGVRARVRSLAERSGGFTLLERRHLEPGVIGAWLRMNGVPRSFWILKIGVEPLPPRRVNLFELTSAPPPGVDVARLWPDFDAMLKGRRFTTGFIALELAADGSQRTIHAVNPDQRLALGLTGTLWAHVALAELIARGEDDWERPIALDDSLRSLPPSATSSAPAGSELPLRELACRAMRDNDSTAAEHLIALLGRERVESARDALRARAAAEVGADPPADSEPFLTPMELYRLKCGITHLVMRYADSDNNARRLMLEHDVPASAVDPGFYRAWTNPQALDAVGWHASARELALALVRLRELASGENGRWAVDALKPAGSEHHVRWRWPGVFKRVGGEPGALACAWLLEDETGRAVVLALIFNRFDKPLDDQDTASIAAKALENISLIP